MDQATTQMLSAQTEETALADCQVADANGRKRAHCMATGDVLKGVVAAVVNPSHQSGSANCLV